MKNKKQIKKNTICMKDSFKPIKVVFYKDPKTIINQILPKIEGNITVLGRNNKDKENFNINETDILKFLTIHSSKGLEDDNIIIVNLENKINSLPTKIKNHYLLDLIITKDEYPYEEERRLFYVAITRSRNNVYLLVPYYNYSPFVKELIKNNKKDIEFLKY